MTTKLRARVMRATPRPGHYPWFIRAYALTDGPAFIERAAWAPSHPEAMQAAYVMLRDLDRELMDQVHASRATRRKPCPTCTGPIRETTNMVCQTCGTDYSLDRPTPIPATSHLTLTEATA